MLSAIDLTVTYRGVVGVRGVKVEIGPGETVSLLGPNGAGKSSVLRGLLGSAPTTGRVVYDGTDISKWPPHRRARAGILQVPTGGRVFGELSAEENLQLGAFGARRKEREERLEEVLDFFPLLTTLRKARAGDLSGGEQQLLALGRALMARPRVLLLDEPSLGLAPVMVKEMYRHIARLRELNIAMVIVDQNAYAAMEISDSVVILNRGTHVYAGTVENARNDVELVSAHLGLSAAAS
jgi:branched-chain amino acid transport system ATP-binding protein